MYETFEAASNAVDAMIGQYVTENPDLDGDAVAFDVVVAIAETCTPEVATELRRTWIGF